MKEVAKRAGVSPSLQFPASEQRLHMSQPKRNRARPRLHVTEQLALPELESCTAFRKTSVSDQQHLDRQPAGISQAIEHAVALGHRHVAVIAGLRDNDSATTIKSALIAGSTRRKIEFLSGARLHLPCRRWRGHGQDHPYSTMPTHRDFRGSGYSHRSATIGSTFAALRAGITQATSAITVRAIATEANVRGSRTGTP